ncbi:conjugal transfer protein TraC [Salmonella enterica]|nr:conjugal transfer protein TraC [Salmonella enterica]
MTSTEHPARHLLWCMLMALRAANEERQFHSEKERRRWLREWLRSARKTAPFHRLPDEIDTLRQLLDINLSMPIEDVLSTLLTNSAAADNCDLFRFRAALSAAIKKGWHTAICRYNDEIVHETLRLAGLRKRHILQLSRTEEYFAPTGEMTAPVTFLLIQPQNRNQETVEQIFHDERFQVVTGREGMLNGKSIRTLWIGRHTLPESVWGARPGGRCTWKPAYADSASASANSDRNLH